MRSSVLIFWLSACFSLGNPFLSAQDCKTAIRQAVLSHRQGDFRAAFELLLPFWNSCISLKKYLPELAEICWDANELDHAKEVFLSLEKEKKYFAKAQLRLAQISQQQLDFRSAILYYKSYYKTLPSSSPVKRELIRQIQHCIYGIDAIRKPSAALVEALSSRINTDQDEYGAYQSPLNPEKYYYSAIRPQNKGGKQNLQESSRSAEAYYRADVYITELNKSSTQEFQDFHSKVNSNYDDVLMSISDDGRSFIFYQSWEEDKGKLIVDSLSFPSEKMNFPDFSGPVNPLAGEGDFCLFQDSVIIFSSDRMGGFGGRDLYISFLRSGIWTEAINLGSAINSASDEIHPFLARNGRSLYFSSNRPQGMGGFDIFRSSFGAEEEAWRAVENLGYPINSPGNEYHFRLQQDALTASFSSDRKIQNRGRKDIYRAVFNHTLQEQAFPPYGSILGLILATPILEKNLTDEHEVQASKGQTELDPHQSFELEDFIYWPDRFQKSPKYEIVMDQLVRLMRAVPGIKLRVLVHSEESASASQNLYFGSKIASQLYSDLAKREKLSQNIVWIALGNEDPIHASGSDRKQNTNLQINKRLEFLAELPDTHQTKLHHIRMRSLDPMAVKPGIRNGLLYALRFHSGSGPAPELNPEWNKLPSFAICDPAYDRIDYYCGIFSDYREIENFRRSKTGLSSYPVVAFLKGRPLGREELVEHALEYPDLLFVLDEMLKLH